MCHVKNVILKGEIKKRDLSIKSLQELESRLNDEIEHEKHNNEDKDALLAQLRNVVESAQSRLENAENYLQNQQQEIEDQNVENQTYKEGQKNRKMRLQRIISRLDN